LTDASTIFADEGGQFISGHGMNADNRLKTAAGSVRAKSLEP
jgi:hypothetical protein